LNPPFGHIFEQIGIAPVLQGLGTALILTVIALVRERDEQTLAAASAEMRSSVADEPAFPGGATELELKSRPRAQARHGWPRSSRLNASWSVSVWNYAKESYYYLEVLVGNRPLATRCGLDEAGKIVYLNTIE
jgi:hypothetical protein